MYTTETKKLALIRIWQILREHSDCYHLLTQEDISNYLESLYGITIERKAIARNISLLKEAGIDIETTRKGAYLAARDFEDTELQMIIDSILFSRYITSSQSKDLIERISKLSSKYFQDNVEKTIKSINEVEKTDNNKLFYNMGIIDNAINEKKQIKYEYNKYGVDKKLHKTSDQTMTPILTVLHNQRYFLIGYSEKHKDLSFHRLDHMTNVKELNSKSTSLKKIKGIEKGIDYKELTTTKPYMFSDKAIEIEFLANSKIVDQIIDWFGKDVEFKKYMGSEDIIHVTLKSSQLAMKVWALQFLDVVEILKPVELRDEIKNIIEEARKKYSK